MPADPPSATLPTWLAFHIFYHGDQDMLLGQCIKPLVQMLRSRGDIGSYFFVRYWNGGPHIRLRLKAVADRAAVRDLVQGTVGDFLKDVPGGTGITSRHYSSNARRRLPSGDMPRMEEVEPLRPPDTVEERPYVYEASRYGEWEAARTVAERHFQFSSDLAMFVLAQTPDQTDARLTIALSLTAVAARASGLGAVAAAQAFRTACDLVGRVGSGKRQEPNDLFVARGFPDVKHLRPQVASVVRSVFEDDVAAMGGAQMARLLTIWRDDLRATLDATAASAPLSANHGRLRLMAIDYMHMLNNRLGIPVDQECFAYSLVADALEDRLDRPHQRRQMP